ncbi:probable glucan endo-1,3-beta-glucosidase BG4 [Tripterygium wilfordii]|uniref:probable glucan endo-1,3-beta-glucosidase BG4 n=1 Tax=Tripterygium wilfordii TaxID=458696 RepID=UPI0018F7E82A|nr:probable glucan endo-1,3-beta-glucosidase BG4 [Tripterygium wilfordii]
MSGNDLPSVPDTINLFNKYGIGKIRLYAPHPEALNALKGTEISVTVGDQKMTYQAWQQPNLPQRQGFQPISNLSSMMFLFSYIVVGNDDIAGETLTITTTVSSTAQLGPSYPPSIAAFTSTDAMKGVLQFLSQQGSPLMINVYPYYAYAAAAMYNQNFMTHVEVYRDTKDTRFLH